MSGLNCFAKTGLAGSLRSTIVMPCEVPARYAYWHAPFGPGTQLAVWPVPGGTTASPPNSDCAKSMKPFGDADAIVGDAGSEISTTYRIPTPSLGSFEISSVSPP